MGDDSKSYQTRRNPLTARLAACIIIFRNITKRRKCGGNTNAIQRL
nr:MAG TPA: hypothetical protein [Caudoviricetes sp.]